MFRIITGRSGSGKTEEIFRMMKSGGDSVYIVPEQYSFAAEKKVTHAFGMSGMGNPDVFSLKRLAYFFEEMYGGNTREDISSVGRTMVLADITRRKAQEMTLYGGSARRGDMAKESAVIVTTFKKYGITKEKIDRAMEKTENPLLFKKLSDCKVICEAYGEFLKEGYRDGEDVLEGLCRNIQRTDYLAEKDVYIDSFQAFTPLEYEVILNILKKARSVTIALCAYEGIDEFETANRTKRNLIAMAKRENVKYLGETVLEGAMFTACDELKALEESFVNEAVRFENATGRIRLHRAKSEYSEIENAALEVERLCREEGQRYRDIVIVARDAEKYKKNLKRVFKRFDIPLFTDQKTPLANEAVAVFLLSAVRIVSGGWKNENVFEYMKTAFSPILPEEGDKLENYCLASGVKRRDWKSERDWDMPSSVKETEEDDGYLEEINLIRRRLTEPVLKLEEKIKGRQTGRDICTAFYEFMQDCKIEERLERRQEKLAESGDNEGAMKMKQVYDLVCGVLESFDLAFCDKEMNAKEFAEIFAVGMESVEIGVIPSTTDCVCVGSIDRARSHGAKNVIIIGAKEGEFPAVPKDTGIFTDADRRELARYSIELPPDITGKIYMEESLVYSALTCATDNLYVSYAQEGENAKPSSIIKRLYTVFPMATVTDDAENDDAMNHVASARSTYERFAAEYAGYRNGEETDDVWLTALDFYKNTPMWSEKIKEIEKYTSYENKTEVVKEELIRARYGKEFLTSVSRLEGYAKCPFEYFAEVTLGLKKRQELEVTAADSGTFLHEFVDLFGKGLEEDGKSWRDLDDGYIDKKTEEITLSLLSGINRHLLETSPRVRHLFAELKRIAKRSVSVLGEHMKKGKFEPLGYEIVFDKNGQFKPVTIELPTGQKAILRGRVDRADILETAMGKFVRIIDYKSGNKKFSMSNIYHGFDLQLAVYLTAVCENEGCNPAGMLYFRIDDPIIDAPSAVSDEKVKSEIVKKLKMDGLVLADEEILEAMDEDYAKGSSVINVKKKKDGSFTENSCVASESDFEAVSKHARSVVKKLAGEIMSGRNDIKPVRGACEWCEMKALCGFDVSIKGSGYKRVEKINDKDALLKIIEEEKTNNA